MVLTRKTRIRGRPRRTRVNRWWLTVRQTTLFPFSASRRGNIWIKHDGPIPSLHSTSFVLPSISLLLCTSKIVGIEFPNPPPFLYDIRSWATQWMSLSSFFFSHFVSGIPILKRAHVTASLYNLSIIDKKKRIWAGGGRAHSHRRCVKYLEQKRGNKKNHDRDLGRESFMTWENKSTRLTGLTIARLAQKKMSVPYPMSLCMDR